MDMIRYDSKLQLRKIPIKYPELTNKKVPAQKDSDGKFYYSGYKNVDRFTRAGYKGREIICPMCDTVSTVNHFSWSSLTCPNCDCKHIPKISWWTK